MKPVDQTTFGQPGGNCFSACVASLLELPISEVPYFMDESNGRGHWTKRGDHSVVALGPDVVHDPHPKRDFLPGSRDGFVLLVPLFGALPAEPGQPGNREQPTKENADE